MTIAALQADLRRAALAGEDTAEIRAAIDAAVMAQAREAEEAAHAAEAAAAVEAQFLRSRAETIAAASVGRITTRIAALKPPAAPALPTTASLATGPG